MVSLRLAPLLVLLPFTTGCRDALGLNDLKFQAPPTANMGGAAAEPIRLPTIPGPTLTKLPLPLDPQVEPYPARGALGRALFITYNAANGELTSYEGTADELTVHQHRFVSDLTDLIATSSAQGPLLFGYSRGSGLTYLAANWENGPEQLTFVTSAGSPDYSDFGHYYWDGFSPERLLAHRLDTGFFRYVPFPGATEDSVELITGELPVAAGQWRAWPTRATPTVMNFDPELGEARFYELGAAPTLLATWKLPQSATLVAPFQSTEFLPALAIYDGLSGAVTIAEVTELTGGTVTLGATSAAHWRTGLSALWPTRNQGRCLTWDAVTRVLSLESLQPLTDSGPVVVK